MNWTEPATAVPEAGDTVAVKTLEPRVSIDAGAADTDVVVATFCRIGPAEATEPLAAITTRPLNSPSEADDVRVRQTSSTRYVPWPSWARPLLDANCWSVWETGAVNAWLMPPAMVEPAVFPWMFGAVGGVARLAVLPDTLGSFETRIWKFVALVGVVGQPAEVATEKGVLWADPAERPENDRAPIWAAEAAGAATRAAPATSAAESPATEARARKRFMRVSVAFCVV